MSTRFNKAYLFVPVIYVGVIFGLLFLQFSGGERFTRTVGPLSLRATRNVTSDGGEPAIRGLNVEFNGLAFDFDEGSGLVIESSDAILEAEVRGFSQIDGGFLLEFAGDFQLEFTAASDPVPEVRLSLIVPEAVGEIGGSQVDPSGIREISIPFRFVGTASPATGDQSSFVPVSVEDREFFFTAPHDALIDPANEKIVFEPSASGRTVRYVEAVAGNPSAVRGWFSDGRNTVSDAEYRRAVEDFVDSAYRGWTSTRYNASTLTWDGASGSARFSEDALTAYLAEAWRRDDYERAYSEMRRAGDLHPDQLGLLSSAFLGNLGDVSAGLVAADSATSEEIRRDIGQNRASVFRRADLFLFAADRGDDGLYQEVLDFAASVDIRSVDVTTAVGMLANSVVSDHPDTRASEVSARFNDLADTLLLGSIVQTDDGFFLQSAPGQIDLTLSITAGVALASLGEARDDQILVAAGRNLVVSGIRTADADGFVPASLIVRGESVEPGAAQIAPESLYPLIADNASYPHQISLYEQAGAGTWAWTIVDMEPARISGSEWRLSLRYPRLRTHYLIVSGVPEFDRLELFGQTWRDAPDFEIYSKGRHYQPETDRLLVKYYDDSVQRDIVIYF